MTVTIRKINPRLRSKSQLKHMPSGHGDGKWESRASLWKYKQLTRRRRLIAKASRRHNRLVGR